MFKTLIPSSNDGRRLLHDRAEIIDADDPTQRGLDLLDRRFVILLAVHAAAGIFQDDHAEVARLGIEGSVQAAVVGVHAHEKDRLDAEAAQNHFQDSHIEPAIALLGHDRLVRLWRDLRHDLARPADVASWRHATHEARARHRLTGLPREEGVLATAWTPGRHRIGERGD